MKRGTHAAVVGFFLLFLRFFSLLLESENSRKKRKDFPKEKKALKTKKNLATPLHTKRVELCEEQSKERKIERGIKSPSSF